ncbi:hypothetical protein FIBSPDRAFT_878832 [Athelia psychrophila]|uniref:Mid2 domain-containing protein n=1 Tax=Athelia psychrophila TaxID=1759441 RepID=A0A167UP43_9AGAM|nr:hypothetical protein FIBSPDRAFT_878832 [Fibularhizoctonia sp. CBS 109695]
MKLVSCLCLFFLLLNYTFAAPKSHDPTTTTSTTSASKTESSTSSLSTSAPNTSSTPLGTQGPPTHSTHRSSTIPQTWTRPPSTPTPQSASSNASSGPKPVAIVGIVFGTLCLVAFAAGFARCWWKYHKTPGHDRIAAMQHRHQLQREMDEQAAEPIMARVRRPPPPPYRPPPPGYESVLPASPPPAHTTTPLTADWEEEDRP